jgi:hypothetical protein
MEIKAEALGSTVLRIELVHVLLVASVWLAFLPTSIVESSSLIAGALFMGVNFLLLSFGIRWVLAPFAERGRIKRGVTLLVLKMILFLGGISVLLFRVRLDLLSFALGFTCLLVAITLERTWAFVAGES